MRKKVTSRRKPRKAPARRKRLSLYQIAKVVITREPPGARTTAKRRAPKRRKKITLADLFKMVR